MKHKQILLIDDDEDDQYIFKDALSEISDDIECATAVNGIEALNMLRNNHKKPSLIFLDLNMPMMNGIECLHHIRSETKLKDIPVVIFTTSDNPSDKKKTSELGADIFFTKTANFKILKSRLKDILQTDFNR